ncbi:MAG TPA: hypothetical protein VMU59_12425 [Caulobacteraceae bacterium]|nr:hypothetical protein [Caulobacteraceae bacterium]
MPVWLARSLKAMASEGVAFAGVGQTMNKFVARVRVVWDVIVLAAGMLVSG